MRAAIVGPSETVPVANGELVTGTWQQIVLVDFDDRPRERRVVVQVVGSGSAAAPGVPSGCSPNLTGAPTIQEGT